MSEVMSGGGAASWRRIGPIAVALAGLAALTWAAWTTGGARYGDKLAYAAVIGGLAGLSLYHASFGFTGGWRRMQREGRGAGFRAQLLLIAMVVVISFPMIALKQTGAWVFPFGVASAIGAMVFGFGMQLGGGCGSGTLFTVGGGSTRMVVTLLAFLTGSLIWSGYHEPFNGLPYVPGTSLISMLGAPGALALTLAVLAGLAYLTIVWEKKVHGSLEPPKKFGALVNGPWPLWFGAVALTLVVLACFFFLGRPWGVTAAYPLWGAKLADLVGVPVREWSAWKGGAIDRSIFSDTTSVMNLGVILGALGAAGLAGAYAPKFNLGFRDLATAVIGGLLMGYGARLAYGCNIGGFVGGVVSASLHGWWWLVFGWIGSIAGVWMRGLIGMDPPLAKKAA